MKRFLYYVGLIGVLFVLAGTSLSQSRDPKIVIQRADTLALQGYFSFTGDAGRFEIPGGTTLPSSAVAGMLFYKSDTKVVYFYNGASWVAFSSGVAGDYLTKDGTTALTGEWDAGTFEIISDTLNAEDKLFVNSYSVYDTLVAHRQVYVNRDSIEVHTSILYNIRDTYLTGNESITLSGDVSGSGTTAINVTIASNAIEESMLKAVNASTDEDILTYEAATGDFEWHTPAELGLGGSQDFADVLGKDPDANDVDITSLGKLEFFDAGLYLDADADGVMDITSDGTLELHSADWDISTTGEITNASGSNSQWTNDEGYITATLTQEEVEDYAGGLWTGNTETGATVTYQEADNTLDIVIDHDAANNFEANEHIDWTQDQGATNIHSGNYTDTNTQLSQAEVEDYAGGLWTGNTETNITVTYQEDDNTLDIALDAAATLDEEWNTEGEVETVWGSVNILLETEIDASSELLALMDDETGTGLLVFATAPTFTTSITMGDAELSEAELEILDGATASTADLNIIDGISDSGDLTAAELLYVDGVTSSIQDQINAIGAPDFADVLGEDPDANDVDITSLGKLEFFDAGLYLDADADGVMDITSDGTLELHSADWDISTTGEITNASGSNSQWTNDEGYITATLTQEEVEDYAGGLWTGNTETGATVTYQEADNTLDIVIDHDAANNFEANEHIDWTQDQGATNIHSGNYTDTNTQLSQAEVEDYAGGLWTGNTETNITVTYQEDDNTLDIALDAAATLDEEWNTEGEVETVWGSVNILLETEIDASSELLALMDDETGTGLLVFATAPTFTTSITMGDAELSEAELEILDGATASTADLNIIDGISDSGDLTAAELLYVDGVTSSIQTQLGNMLNKDGTVGLTGDWDAGDYEVEANKLYVTVNGAAITAETSALQTTFTKSGGDTDDADDIWGANIATTMNDGDETIGYLTGLRVFTRLQDGTIGAGTEDYRGIYNELEFDAGTAGKDAIGTLTWLDFDGGTVTGDAYGHYIDIDLETEMTDVGDDVFGLYITIDDDEGVNGTVYDIYLDSQTGVDYGIYQADGAPNYFAGNIATAGEFIIGSASINETELEIIDGATASTADLNIIDGISDSGDLTAAELLYVDGVTSSIQDQINALSGTMSTVEQGDAGVGDADIVTLDFADADFAVTEDPNTEINIAIEAAITRDEEWNTEGEVETVWGDVNILLETEIDASSELLALMDDETGTGLLVFGTAPTFASTITIGTNGGTSGQINFVASDNDNGLMKINTNDQIDFQNLDAVTFSNDIHVADDITHQSDTDTEIQFDTDQIKILAGNEIMLTMYETTQDYIELGDDGDIDIKLSAGVDGALTVEGSSGNVSIAKDLSITEDLTVTLATTLSDSVTIGKWLKLDASPDADSTFSGTAVRLAVGEDVDFGEVLFMHTDGELMLAEDDDVENSPALWVSVDTRTVNDGESALVAQGGSYIRDDDGWDFTAGDYLFVSTTAGIISATAPSTAGEFVYAIGVAITADVIFIFPAPVPVKIAE